jgi:hypothetical protein
MPTERKSLRDTLMGGLPILLPAVGNGQNGPSDGLSFEPNERNAMALGRVDTSREAAMSLKTIIRHTLLVTLCLTTGVMPTRGRERVEPVPPFNPATVNPTLFKGEEYEYGYYLVHLSTVANAVAMDGEHRGFITRPVWRPPLMNVPGNARVLQNHVALAFFYTVDRPWNIYRGNKALRARLEAVLDYLVRTQHEDGRLGSDKVAGAPLNLELAGSSFGVKYLGETLLLLEMSRRAGGPTIDPDIHRRTIAATRRTIEVLLTRESFVTHAKRFSNQYPGFWGGTLAFLSAHPDEALRQRLAERIKEVSPMLTSPAGYHYELGGCDWGYSLGTQYANVRHVWNYARGTSFMDPIIAMERQWIEWLAYNAVREPDGTFFTLNRAIQTRLIHYGGFRFAELPLAESIPLARAFARTHDEHNLHIQQSRQRLIERWPDVGRLKSYSPRIFTEPLVRPEWRPTASDRDAAIASLPYLARDRFVHQRADDRKPMSSTFVRRPSYYTTFNAGAKVADMQRYGLGLLWNPQMGTVLQTQSGSVAPWGTSRKGDQPFEANEFHPKFKIDGREVTILPGARYLPGGESGRVVFEYALLEEGMKTVTFGPDRIAVSVRLPGEFIEHIPLLLREGDELSINAGVVRLRRGERVFEIVFPAGTRATKRQATGWPPAPFRVIQLTLKASGSLDYSIAFK